MAPNRPATDWRRLRDEANLSTRELSRRSGISHVYITHIENGRMFPTAAEALAIGDALREAIAEREEPVA